MSYGRSKPSYNIEGGKLAKVVVWCAGLFCLAFVFGFVIVIVGG